MRSRLCFFSALALLGIATAVAASAPQPQSAPPQTKPAAPPTAAASGDIAVVVNYTGKGAVDAAHEVLVFLFDNPTIDNDSRPMNMQAAQKNGETVTFKGVTAPVYICVVYNETGNYHGNSGPPPAGTPFAIYAKDAKSPPTAVTPGGKAPVKVSFSDARRWGK